MRLFFKIFCVAILLPLMARAADTNTPPPTDEGIISRGNTLFATQLYAQLRNQNGNVFLSPASIRMALTMAYGGARGTTAAEMANTLHFALPGDRLHTAMAKLLSDLNAEGKANGYQLNMDNALWLQKGFRFEGDFLKLMQSSYGGELHDVDFMGNAEAARGAVNEWVDKKTNHKITTLIAPGTFDQLTRMVLTDVIYFKGDWFNPFDKKETSTDDFHTTKEKSVAAPLMHRTGSFNYLDGGAFQALEIPYKNRDLSMIVFLPNAVDGLGAFEQSMTAEHLQQWMDSLRSRPDIQLTLPKFKMGGQFELAGTLKAMGMGEAFDKNIADFSGMTGRRELYISRVIHKAYADVNEEGTEAAAATAVVMKSLAAIALPAQPVVFRADHPFVFLIRDNHSGTVLFMGRMNDPTR